jgi:polyisoprenoid-binding protein YceI
MVLLRLLVVLSTIFGTASAQTVEAPLDVKASSLKFTGHAFLHDFNGEAKQFSGSAKIDAQKSQAVLEATINIATARMTTFENARDRNMLDWLHADANPDILFRLTRVVPVKGDPAAATADHPARFAVTGDFTLNKTVRPVEAQALGLREGKWLVVTGTTRIDTTEFGLPIVQQLFLTVDKKVDIAFRLAFELPPDLQRTVPR